MSASVERARRGGDDGCDDNDVCCLELAAEASRNPSPVIVSRESTTLAVRSWSSDSFSVDTVADSVPLEMRIGSANARAIHKKKLDLQDR